MIEFYCKNCNKRISYGSWYYGTKLCRRCVNLGKNNPNYKRGKTHNNKCIVCNKKISYNAIRCASCATKNAFKIGKRQYRKIKKCLDCNKILKDNRSKRCLKCVAKIRGIKMKGILTNPKCGFGKGKYYKKIWMRSSYEIAYAKYLDKNNIKWLYEPQTFDLGNTTYTPDFYLPKINTYIEIKGWFSPIARKKYQLFKNYYSQIKIKILYKNNLQKLGVL